MVVAASPMVAMWPSAGGAPTAAAPPVTVFTAAPGAMAEASVTADPRRPQHLAAAADPYLDPVRILVATSDDAGATWSQPIPILPDGFAKSYDPNLAFDDGGDLVVIGGASGQSAPHCQPGSAVFMARIRGSDVRYTLVRDARVDHAYVDRPALAVADSGDASAYVTWTESSGVGAECRGTPFRSKAMFARITGDGPPSAPSPLPSSGLSAPFGTAMAFSAAGVLNVAVEEHNGNGQGRLVLVRSADKGITFQEPVIVDSGRDVAQSLSGLGGLIAPIPSLAAADDGRMAVAWATGSPGGAEVSVYEAAPEGPWLPLALPDKGGTTPFSRVAYDRSGLLWLLLATSGDGSLSYALRSHGHEWSGATSVARSPSTGFIEIGESLGLVAAGPSLVAVFPVDGATGSSLEVARVALSPGPTTSASVPSPTTRSPARSRRVKRSPRTPALFAAVVMGLLAAVGVATFYARRFGRH